MNGVVAVHAEGDEVLHRVVTLLTTEHDVVYAEVVARVAVPALPLIPRQDFLAQALILRR